MQIPIRSLLVLAAAAAATLLTACGGGGSSASDTGSPNYDPAQEALNAAGLEVCGEAQEKIPQTLSTGNGLQGSRGFYVATQCNGAKATPNTILEFQYDSRSAVDAAAPAIRAAIPTGLTMTSGPLVIVATGPDKAQNLASVRKELQTTTKPTTTNG